MLYRDLPDLVGEYAGIIYLRYNETLDLEIAARERIIEGAFKHTLQSLYKL
jgi:hypothetical protein